MRRWPVLKYEWIDGKREPQSPPDPNYPEGIDVIAVGLDAVATCEVKLPYPAKRCGIYVVECDTCGLTTIVTTAGRPDDPRSLTVACKREPTR